MPKLDKKLQLCLGKLCLRILDKSTKNFKAFKITVSEQVIRAKTAQMVKHRLGTTKVVESNLGKGEDCCKKSEFEY